MQRRTDSHVSIESLSTARDIAIDPNAEVQQPPIPARVAPQWRATHQRSLLQYFRQTPSWLLSLILHLGWMLMLASLVVPYGEYTRLDQLFVSFGQEPIQDLSRTPIVVETPQAREVSEDEGPTEPSPVQQQTDDNPPAPIAGGEPKVDLQRVSKVLREFFRARPSEPEAQMVRIEPVARVESTFDRSRYETEENQRADEIVERFIQYDVGRLRGREGSEARRKFQQLGPSAIPALVRGLNRSASIHASCPVGVISSKLTDVLRNTDDPGLVDYALKNLGRNIPRGAPHRTRVLALRNQLQTELGQRREQIEKRLGELGWSVDQSSINRIASLHESNLHQLRSALRDDDAWTSETATMSVLLRSNEFDTQTQAQLGLTIADLIDWTTDPQRLDLLQQTSRHLADRQDISPDLKGSDWRAYWLHQMRVQMMSGLSAARQLRELGDGDVMTRRAVMEAIARSSDSISDSLKYQMSDLILRDLESGSNHTSDLAHQALVRLASGKDVGGPSAEAWREYWITAHFERTIVPRSETHLRQAMFLEQRGKRAAAAKKYRQLIESFPETPAAESAAERLRFIIRRSRS